ncbi:hypothetical protein [Microbacterium gorillae]|uniref:hypothetical protein n=1 Tax=Microbacterium gorillae TaxID=1231063 RepID=UPI003D97F4BF
MGSLMFYPEGALSSGEQELADYGAALLRQLARGTGSGVDADLSVIPLNDGAIVVVERIKGGAQLYVAADRAVLYVGSGVSERSADAMFAKGRRTPLSSFGPEAGTG